MLSKTNIFVTKTKNDTKEDSKNPEYYEYLDYKPNQEYVVGNIYNKCCMVEWSTSGQYWQKLASSIFVN